MESKHLPSPGQGIPRTSLVWTTRVTTRIVGHTSHLAHRNTRARFNSIPHLSYQVCRSWHMLHHFDSDAKTCKKWLTTRKVHRECARSWKKANNTKKAPYIVRQPRKHEAYFASHVLMKCVVCGRHAMVPKTLRNQKPSGKNACGCQCAEQLCV